MHRRPCHGPLALTALLWISCGGGGGGGSSSGSAATGVRVIEDRVYFVDPHHGGDGGELELVDVLKGRIVDVFGLGPDGEPVLMLEDLVIAPNLASDAHDYLLEQHPVLGTDQLTIRRDVTDREPSQVGGASPFEEFQQLCLAAQEHLLAVPSVDLEVSHPPMVERNAALVLVFDDLLDGSTVSSQTVITKVGLPPDTFFQPRVFPSPNHGDFTDTGFHSTRVIVDVRVSEVDGLRSSSPLFPNAGLPPAHGEEPSNAVVLLPTRSFGGSPRLTNLRGRVLDDEDLDTSSVTRDLVLSLRSGGAFDQVGDPRDGFLEDSFPPQWIGELAVELPLAPAPLDDDAEAGLYRIPHMASSDAACARPLVPGDSIVSGGVVAEVLEEVPLVQGEWLDVPVRLRAYPAFWDELHPSAPDGRGQGYLQWPDDHEAQGELRTALTADDTSALCFLGVTPAPDQAGIGLSPSSTFHLRFNEPLSPASWQTFESSLLVRGNSASPDSVVIGHSVLTDGCRVGRFIPDFPLAHEAGGDDLYTFFLAPERRPADTLGNPLVGMPAPLALRLDPAAPEVVNKGRVQRFLSLDEQAPAGFPEWSGQVHVLDGFLLPRAVTRFDALLDPSLPVPSTMGTFVGGVQTPIAGMGSKMQVAWRSADLGFQLEDRDLHDLDVEGLSWAQKGSPSAEIIEGFETRLAHSRYLPDELFDPSGLRSLFSGNILEHAGGGQTTVHPRSLGYVISPSDAYVASSGTTLMPYPWNRGLEPEAWTTFTWRDTRIRERAAPAGGGSDVSAYFTAIGATPPAVPRYPAGEVPTVGLPLLLEFRTYPDPTTFGLNAFDILLTSPTLPAVSFRAFSTGGNPASGPPKIVNPDGENSASGGIDPTTGLATPGLDPVTYIGSADMVVRMSHAHSVWFPTGYGTPRYGSHVLVPSASGQPPGTSIQATYRGADSVGTLVQEDANRLDSYGDDYPMPFGRSRDAANPTVNFSGGDDHWGPLSSLDGSAYFQVRLTFQSNIATGEEPTLSAYGISWDPGF